MDSPYLSVIEVSKSYDGKQRAVDGISLDVAKGEFVTFLGPSGSGKTTTLMMIAGFETASAGDIRIAGRSIAKVPPYDRNIGMVFQNYALFPHMNVAANIGFPLRMRRVAKPEAQREVKAALAMVGLEAFAGKHPRELSGGQQQRVALARALVFKPDLLLLDEPLGALDKNLREQMQVEIKRIHRELGITTIYVTHDQTEAMTMSDRVAVFNRGRIEQVAPPLEVYSRPRTHFVGSFVGDSNFFEAVVADPAAGLLEVPGLGRLQAAGPFDLAAGTAVHAMVRPEVIRPEALLAERPDRPSAAAAALLDYRVEGIVNYGDSVLLIGRSAGHPLRVRLPMMEATGVREGDGFRVFWERQAMHVIPRA